VTHGLTRAAEIVQAEIERAESLLNIEDDGAPVFNREQTEAGICALRTVLEAIRREAAAVGPPMGPSPSFTVRWDGFSSAVRVCDMADAECGMGCGLGPCKRKQS
jgi:hypothetical protein